MSVKPPNGDQEQVKQVQPGWLTQVQTQELMRCWLRLAAWDADWRLAESGAGAGRKLAAWLPAGWQQGG